MESACHMWISISIFLRINTARSSAPYLNNRFWSDAIHRNTHIYKNCIEVGSEYPSWDGFQLFLVRLVMMIDLSKVDDSQVRLSKSNKLPLGVDNAPNHQGPPCQRSVSSEVVPLQSKQFVTDPFQQPSILNGFPVSIR